MVKRQKASTSTKKFYFDKAAADRAARFFKECLVHVEAEWAGQPFILEPWQAKIIRDVFGWKRRSDGTRKYRTLYIEIPRKNGKSTFVAGIGDYLLFADREPGAKVYSAAADREQAAIVFDTAKLMCENSVELSARCEVYRRSIYVPSTASNYHVLSADVKTKHGKNSHGILFDELHAQPNRDLWDVLTTSTGSRRQPLTVAITTAGYDKNSVCGEQHEYAKKLIKGIIKDDSFYAVIYGMEKEGDKTLIFTGRTYKEVAARVWDKWDDEKIWKIVNPNLGVSLKPDYLRDQCKKAKESPAFENTFRRLQLDQWTTQIKRWLQLSKWDACNGKVDAKALGGQPCYVGLDLANSIDIAALTMVFPPEEEGGIFKVLPFFWIPEENIYERSKRDKVPYDLWVRKGFIEATPGNVIDYASIKRRIFRVDDDQKEVPLIEIFNIKQLGFDRWGAQQISQELAEAGIDVVALGQGFMDMSPPTKELLKLVISKKIAHGGNPVLRWMADNMVVRTDPAQNIKPDKAKSTEKIDGMVALIMALALIIRGGGQEKSVYEERGILTI